jgi:glycosyltransferase involved in cell wall biosynthesis
MRDKRKAAQERTGKKPLVSVIIPAHDEEKMIRDCLLSVYNQSYKNLEAIVVCNGCRDRTRSIAQQYFSKVLDLRAPGTSRARNAGARAASGEILVFLDADSVMRKDMIGKVVSVMDSGYVGGTARTLPLENIPKARFMWWLKDKANFFFLTASGNIFCRRSEFQGFREDVNIAEDTFVVEALKRRGRFKYLRDTNIRTSMRRHEKNGYLRTILKVTSGYFYRKKVRYEPVR